MPTAPTSPALPWPGFARRRDETGPAFLVGDTPSDMHAAKVTGVAGIGVATGHYSIPDLVDAGAALAVDNLADPAVARRLGLTP